MLPRLLDEIVIRAHFAPATRSRREEEEQEEEFHNIQDLLDGMQIADVHVLTWAKALLSVLNEENGIVTAISAAMSHEKLSFFGSV